MSRLPVIKIAKKAILLVLFFYIAFSAGFLSKKFVGPKVLKLMRTVRKSARQMVSRKSAQAVDDFISNFENEDDLSRWFSVNSVLQPAQQYVRYGKYSGEIILLPSNGASGIIMQDNLPITDWSGYDGLEVYFYNPEESPIRIIIKLKDGFRKAFQKDIHLQPQKTTRFYLPISEIKEVIDVSDMFYMNFFAWRNPSKKSLYIDGVKLIPMESGQARERVIFQGLNSPREAAAGESLSLSLYFSFLSPTEKKYLVFCELTPVNSVSSGTAESDRVAHAEFFPPLPTTKWRQVGVNKVGPFQIEIPDGTAPGKYVVIAGLMEKEPETGHVKRLSYANPDIKDFVVGEIVIEKKN